MSTHRVKSSLVLVGVLLGVGNQLRAQSDTTSEAAVRQAAVRFVDAFSNLDWARFAASFDSTATIFHPSAALMGRIEGRDSLVKSFQGLFKDIPNQRSGPPYLTIRPRDVLVQMVGDAAIVTFHLGERPRLSRRTLVFVRRGDRWLIAHVHASSFMPPADTTR
jgi:ketosteroid isomerase-like protein